MEDSPIADNICDRKTRTDIRIVGGCWRLQNDDENEQNEDMETVSNSDGHLTVLDKANRKIDLANVLTNYVPTLKEQDLLNVLLDPFHRMSSITKICQIANVSRQTYHTMFRKPEFQLFYRQALLETVKQYGGQLINIGIREARKGSFPHWKVLMEMGGFHNDKRVTEHEGEVTMKVSFISPDSDLDEE